MPSINWLGWPGEEELFLLLNLQDSPMHLPANNTVDKAIILLSLVKIDAKELKELQEICHQSDFNWELLYQLAELNETVPLVLNNLRTHQLLPFCPTSLVKQMQGYANDIAKANQLRIETGKILLQEFAKKNIKVALLKGIFFAESVYKNPFYKKMNDIDILILEKDARRVLDVFKQLNYFCVSALLGDSAQDQIAYSHHFPPFFSPNLHCMIGTHWGLISTHSFIQLNYEAMWKRAKPLNFYDVECYHLAPEDNLLHLCIHLSLYKSGIKEIADFYNLIQSNNIDWDLFYRNVKESHSAQKVYESLAIVQTFYPLSAIAKVLEKLKHEYLIRISKALANKISSRSFLLRSRTTYVSAIEKEFIQFKATSSFAEKHSHFFRIWKLIFYPPVDQIQKLTFRPTYSPFLRLLVPLQISRHLSAELGTKTYFLLHCYLIYSLIKSGIRNLLGIKKKSFQDFCDDLGLSVEQINQLKERLE
ncbi:nucleotidyltransferase family protein [Legionella sp. D16C41]|uniref:nucleotidyltransferase domain-containing protein n=1 Tax=Legionella sp. D16C41 TaxID=3402688 RepID=UPI003AF8DBC6